VAAGNEMRVGDAEREAAAAELQEHFASGRLNQDELNERLTTVFAAKTRGDLNALFSDLPSSGHAGAGADTAGRADVRSRRTVRRRRTVRSRGAIWSWRAVRRGPAVRSRQGMDASGYIGFL